ncbi:ATP-dependent RNA helicase mrh4, mitochondrial [Lepidopterella palustris CBS 459.81]|uniref:RNA helicase n=1 Tax=Lepidopterella palustris CBS 459.81 TaxID=1314670 RepID=A0A8E2JDC4_9PEZI|nr:ATP-dependent RNA helicase mrh4, mitochondrial [Lepidopterella palustris CBS 459.81]
MELSADVSHSRPRDAFDDHKPPKKRSRDPFAGLNQTEARVPPLPSKGQKLERKWSMGERRSAPARKRSTEPFKALKMQRALAAVPYGQRSQIKDQISEMESFEEFELLPEVQQAIADALPGLENVSPTPAQRVAIPELLGMKGKRVRRRNPVEKKEMEQFLLAAETGSGKTLAYLLPVIDAIKRAEAIQLKEEAVKLAAKEAADAERRKANLFELESPPLSKDHNPNSGRPRAIVLVPTAELVAQVGAIAKSLSHLCKFKAAPISASNTATVIRNRLFNPKGVDIVISTPFLLGSIVESNPNILSRVSHLVIDEADSLLDRSFSPITSSIVDRATPSLKQLILCSATIPRGLDTYLQKRFPDIKRLVTPNLHAIPRRVQLGVVDVNKEPYRGNKNLACADTIWTIGRSAAEHSAEGKEKIDMKRIIVFVNEREKAVEVADYLVSKGIDAIALNRDTASERASHILASFKGLAKDEEPPVPSPEAVKAAKTNYFPVGSTSTRKLVNTKVIVTTDLGSRGIDTCAVRHVVLYDVPHTTIDFIHRLGRTGRMGRRGRGIVLVGRGDRTDVVKEVREGMFKGQALI